MESDVGGGFKKLIRALESAETWRPTCSECTDKLRDRRGCRKPGFDVQAQGAPFRFSSPALNEAPGDAILYECPTGYLLREAPHIFSAIEAASTLDNAGPAELRQCSPYLLHAWRAYRAENAGLRELREIRRMASTDSAAGMKARQ